MPTGDTVMTMRSETPVAWLNATAESDPDRICIATVDADYSYGDMAQMVSARASMVSADYGPGQLVPVPVAIDVASVVELLAVGLASRVPMPYVGPIPVVDAEVGETDAIVVPTSGSGGRQRFVRITEENIAAAVAASKARLGNDASDRWLLCLPLNHVGGLAILWRSFKVGGSVALGPFDSTLGRLIERTTPTIASLVPTMLSRVLDREPSLISGMRFVLVGGGAFPESLASRAARHGVRTLSTYGMTEATSQIATSRSEDRTRLVPLDGVVVGTVAADGAALPLGERGRITVDGPTVSPGFIGEPPRHGPYVTNDVGFINADGSLTIIGRMDDIVISGGENVSLGAIAAAVASFDGVSMAAAVGVPDDEWGTAVVGVVVTDLDAASLDNCARSVLAPHERPRRWVIVSHIPLLPNGKPDMAAVRKLVVPAS